MKAIFLFAATAFVLSGLAWYFTWAIWIHAPKGWFGREYSPVEMAEHGFEPEAHHLRWYRWLRASTLVLFFISAALFVAWISTHSG
jgi:hypothetical protein